MNEDGFAWYSIFPGLIAALMAIAILGMLFADDAPDGASDGQPSGDAGDAPVPVA